MVTLSRRSAVRTFPTPRTSLLSRIRRAGRRAPQGVFVAVVAALIAIAAAAPGAIAQTCTPVWAGGFGRNVGDPGLNGGVITLSVFDDGSGPALYAGGFFTTAGGVSANNIAKWDGTVWSLLGSGMNGNVNALTVFDDGTGLALYVGGDFTTAGVVSASNIAKWDGSTWVPLGSGVNNTNNNASVSALTVFDDGTGPALYAGGRFATAGGVSASRIAKWDGSTWSPLGSGMNSTVNALTVFDDGTGPALFAGGFFTTAGGVSAIRIAKWDGTSWSPLGGGVSSGGNTQVDALTVFDDGTGPALYAGGYFSTAGGLPASRIAKWDGSTWSPLGSGINSSVRTLTVFDDGTGPALYAGGEFTTAGGLSASRIAKWDGVSWTPLGTGVSGSSQQVLALTVFDDGTGSSLYAGGTFTTAGGFIANGIGQWNGISWLDSPGNGANDGVNSLHLFDDGSGVAIFAGGTFTEAGNIVVPHIGKFDGSAWSTLGSGVNADVHALEVFNDGLGSALYAGGAFSTAGGSPANKIARWDGGAWSALGAGLDGDVYALTLFDDGSGMALYAGGDFTIAGSAAASRIARWDGQAWTALGAGLDDSVFALKVFDDGTGPALYAGGVFTVAGSVLANMIARWDGAAWSAVTNGAVPLAAPPEVVQAPAVLTLEVFDDGTGAALYAGGSFTVIDNVVARRMARWDGANWTPMGNGMSDPVRSLAVFDDAFGPALYAGGDFATAGTAVAAHVAKWSAGAWSEVDAGTNGPVNALAAMFDPAVDAESLFAGGSFTSAGGLPSSNIGRFAGCPTPPDTFLLVDPADGSVGAILTPTLTWDASMGANTFDLKLGTNPDLTTGLLIDATGLTETSFTIADGVLTQGVVFYWGVTAVNGTGQTPSSQGVFSFTTAPLGDFNFDGTVNGSDLATMLTNWGPCPAPPATCPADIAGTGDGDVNGADLATLLTNWGTP